MGLPEMMALGGWVSMTNSRLTSTSSCFGLNVNTYSYNKHISKGEWLNKNKHGSLIVSALN